MSSIRNFTICSATAPDQPSHLIPAAYTFNLTSPVLLQWNASVFGGSLCVGVNSVRYSIYFGTNLESMTIIANTTSKER